MSKSGRTRAMIVDEALRQASVVGLEGLSLGPLADALGMSKSGLFAHFKSRQALQMDVLETAVTRFRNRVLTPARRRESAAAKLEALFKAWLGWIQAGGCVLTTMAQEYQARPGPLRERLVHFHEDLRSQIVEVVREGAVEGVFRADVDPEQFAFELHGLALSFEQAAHLAGDRKARMRALRGFRRLVGSLERDCILKPDPSLRPGSRK